MALRLRVVSAQADDLGEAATCVFGVHGGRLGRALDNEWPLPDSLRFVSGRHASFEYHGGEWRVVDTSSNGTWINDEVDPIGKGRARRLQQGDLLRIGEYVIEVTIAADNDFAPDSALVGADDDSLESELLLTTHGDIGASLDVKSLLSGPEPVEPVRAGKPAAAASYGAYGPVLVPPVRPARREVSAEPPMPPPNAAPPPTAAQLASVPPPPRQEPLTVALAALSRGLGLDLTTLPPERQAAALSVAGQLLREFTLGVMAQLKDARDHRERFGDTIGHGVPDPNPMQAFSDVDEVLRRMLLNPGNRFLPPVESVRDAFSDLAGQTQAADVATREAVHALVAQFAPESLVPRFERSLAPVGATGDRARYWEMYRDMHRVIAQPRADGLPHAYAEAYAQTLAQELAGPEGTAVDARDARPVAPPRR
jgi:type VI secretion system FHA domain protein